MEKVSESIPLAMLIVTNKSFECKSLCFLQCSGVEEWATTSRGYTENTFKDWFIFETVILPGVPLVSWDGFSSRKLHWTFHALQMKLNIVHMFCLCETQCWFISGCIWSIRCECLFVRMFVCVSVIGCLTPRCVFFPLVSHPSYFKSTDTL